MIEDKELIRRALLGDQKVQEELSNKFIPIPCAFCKADGSNMKVQYDKGVAWMECQVCGACGPLVESDDEYTGEKAAIRAHNTRPAPPVGRCDICSRQKPRGQSLFCYVNGIVHSDGFCDYFKPREK